MAITPAELLTLIDAYAAARAARDDAYSNAAAWAFDLAHADMHAARNAVAAALGITDPAPPAETLDDPFGDVAARSAEVEAVAS